jgi:hypothetical protein
MAILSIFWLSCAEEETALAPPAAGDTYLIVAIGDSLASGQGAPNKPHPQNPTWDDERCNRSENAGTKRAVELLEKAHPGKTFVFKSFACSGAEIEEGLLEPYAGPDPPPGAQDLPPQIDALKDWAGGQTIHALTIAIGGNDLYFGPIVFACVVDKDCSHFGGFVEGRLLDLPGLYDNLYNKMKTLIDSGELDIENVFITEYPDPAHDEHGVYCDHAPPLPELFHGISGDEAEFASQEVLKPLNEIIETKASAYGWIYVGGFVEAFEKHGWCAKLGNGCGGGDRWINTVNESLAKQGHWRGAMHPNKRGHTVYGKYLAEEIDKKLFPPAP